MDRRGVVQSWVPCVTNNPSWISVFSSVKKSLSLLLSYSGIVSLCLLFFSFLHSSLLCFLSVCLCLSAVSLCVLPILKVISLFLSLSLSQSLNIVSICISTPFICVSLLFVQHLFLCACTYTRCRGNPHGCIEVGQDHGCPEPGNQESEGKESVVYVGPETVIR